MPVVEVSKPTKWEQRLLWESLLGSSENDYAGAVSRVVNQFDLSTASIQSAASDALLAMSRGTDPVSALWAAGRKAAGPSMSHLAQRISATATMDDLVLGQREKDLLHSIIASARQRLRVYEEWGFARSGDRGLGISALFSGDSGTGKTTAAEAIAHELDLDLYRIDLSMVVNKYIGETEKNLKKIFDAAEDGGAILLFDEADALFGKRSEVKDSHDRYANIEVGYLLQRMESYRGLAILTTNLKNSLDRAFTRRIRFIVNFPFPDEKSRAEIWRKVFPPSVPMDDLDYGRLATLELAGGNIRNIALGAAFLAADEGVPIGMAHIMHAAREEYDKMGRPFPAGRIAA
jgi:SpoVK/Ycf46/Vps4 family AAA+-type ATPase